MADTRPFLVPVGGFLGAGKTSLILAASRHLAATGLRCAAILNDQGPELVDRELARENGLDAGQVTGGCFCCRFTDLLETARSLLAHQPAVIFAEAVGSCTDLCATVMRPLEAFGAEFRLAPLTVLVDPARARELATDAESAMGFLYRKQIEEADLVCFTKSELCWDTPALEGVPTRHVSSATGEGVAEWLAEIFGDGRRPGARILDIDYDRYARAEAALAWLNCRAQVRLRDALSPAMVVGPLLDELDVRLSSDGLAVVHLKLIDRSPAGWLKAGIVQAGGEPVVEGMMDASPALRHDLLVNVRALGEPEVLREAVESQLRKLAGRVQIERLECFSPSPPKPEHRMGGGE